MEKEIYIRISAVNGKEKDTLQHATNDQAEAIAFIAKHTEVPTASIKKNARTKKRK